MAYLDYIDTNDLIEQIRSQFTAIANMAQAARELRDSDADLFLDYARDVRLILLQTDQMVRELRTRH